MHSDMQHRPSIVLIVLLALLALVLLARPAHSGWSVDPVEIHATSALCPLVATADDAHQGAIVVWQENTATGGFLRARHVLASGDLDPTWIAPAAVSNFDVARSALGAVRDGVGGAYVWWMESNSLWLTRVSSAGAVASGWPARGRNLGQLPSRTARPLVLTDRGGGVYVGWLNLTLAIPSFASIRVQHLGPTGGAAGGWPAGGRSFGYDPADNSTVVSFGMDVGTDGGLWFAWETVGVSMESGAYSDGEIRVHRTTTSGAPVPGWPNNGRLISAYPAFMNFAPGWAPWANSALIAIAGDGDGGAYVFSAVGESDPFYSVVFHQTLRRIDGMGSPSAGWAPEGVGVGNLTVQGGADPGAAASLRLLSDGRGGVYAGAPFFMLHTEPGFTFCQFDGAGLALPVSLSAGQNGLEYATDGTGGMFIASFKPSGATGPNESDSHVWVSQSGGSYYVESVRSYYSTRYGDIGLTATGDGGAIFAWSQLIDRQGIYAIRLNQAGRVTGVIPKIGAAQLRLRFVRGQGVLAVPSLPGSGDITLSLHDLAGRTVSSERACAVAGADVAFPGTRDLPGGVYFARASAGGKELHARVVVAR